MSHVLRAARVAASPMLALMIVAIPSIARAEPWGQSAEPRSVEHDDIRTARILERPVNALIGGNFAEAAAQLSEISSNADPQSDEHAAAVALHTLAIELVTRHLDLRPIGNAADANAADETAERSPMPPPEPTGDGFDGVRLRIVNGDLLDALAKLDALDVDGSDRIVVTALKRILRAWRERGLVPRVTTSMRAVVAHPSNAVPRGEWYGWQTLFAELPLYTTTVAAIALQPDDKGTEGKNLNIALMGSAASYLLTPALIHLAHGNGRSAWMSLGVRAGAPLGGAIALAVATLPIAAVCVFTGPYGILVAGGVLVFAGLIGAVGGTITGIVYDAAVLSYEPAPPSARASTGAMSTVRPFVLPSRGGMTLGLTF